MAVRAQRNTSVVPLDDGSTLTDGRPLKQWQALLPTARFARVHCGAIVRIKAIRALLRRPSGRWHVTRDG